MITVCRVFIYCVALSVINNEGGILTSTEHSTVDVGLVRTSPSDIRLTKVLLLTPNGKNI